MGTRLSIPVEYVLEYLLYALVPGRYRISNSRESIIEQEEAALSKGNPAALGGPVCRL